MSKPRIVRESTTVTMNGLPWMHESHAGKAALLLYWPEACPWPPERVMAACERVHEQPFGVPYAVNGMWEVRVAPFKCYVLTPEFMAEPKPCPTCRAWCRARTDIPPTCPDCGRLVCERRTQGERRKGERRVPLHGGIAYGGRRAGLDKQRRSGNDRRRQP